MLQISLSIRRVFCAVSRPVPPCEGARGSSIGVAVMKQKELSLNHNLMEEAPEAAGVSAGGGISAAIPWTLSSLFGNMEFTVELRH